MYTCGMCIERTWMTFKEYLHLQGINNSTHGPAAYVYAAIARAKPDISYREASLVFVDLPVLSDTFELLWNDYEDVLDLMRPVEGSEIDTDGILLDKLSSARRSEPEHVADITGRILMNILRQEAEHETKQND